MAKNVLVVGMPRSGTSLTASIFSGQGYYLAEKESDELHAGDSHNPLGYFEAESLVQRNAEVLNHTGFPRDNTWLYQPITDIESDQILGMAPLPGHKEFVESYNRNSPWLWKDPRLCYTLGYWWPLLDQENTAVLYIKRSPRAIYQSFVRLLWREPGAEALQDVECRAAHHWAAAEKALMHFNIPHLAIDYDDYLKDPEGLAKKISIFFGLNLQVDDLNVRKELNRSTFKGRLVTWVKRLLREIPQPIKSGLKKLIPLSLLRRLLPENNY